MNCIVIDVCDLMDNLAAILGMLSLAGLVGGMIFFATIMAPVIFTVLEPVVAAGLIRRVFPRYYAYVIVSAALGAIGFAFNETGTAIVLAGIAGLTIWLRQGMMPMINRLRDKQVAGDAGAGVTFDRMHKISVSVNTVQLVLAIGVLVRLAIH